MILIKKNSLSLHRKHKHHLKFIIMKTKTFKEIIYRLLDKGAQNIIIRRSDSYCGCIEPDDIIAVSVHVDERVYVASVCNVFEDPVITVDRVLRDSDGRCVSRYTIGTFKYAK